MPKETWLRNNHYVYPLLPWVPQIPFLRADIRLIGKCKTSDNGSKEHKASFKVSHHHSFPHVQIPSMFPHTIPSLKSLWTPHCTHTHTLWWFILERDSEWICFQRLSEIIKGGAAHIPLLDGGSVRHGVKKDFREEMWFWLPYYSIVGGF